jgi:DMSO/TMAO reductase YedYZ molybdopterin-dependent catalytic subunit
MNKKERIQKMILPPVPAELAHRLPPGQVLTDRFPILHEGPVPEYDLDKWSLRFFGDMSKETQISYHDLMALPHTTIQCDIHCVTRWSKFDTVWEGIRVVDLFKHLKLEPQMKYVMVHADTDYETNLPLDKLLAEDALLAFSYNGQPLTSKHGGPVRLLIPSLYFWKSAKWVTGFEFMNEDRSGFWEKLGFHHVGEPFNEQRFSGQDLNIPDDEWHHKDFD